MNERMKAMDFHDVIGIMDGCRQSTRFFGEGAAMFQSKMHSIFSHPKNSSIALSLDSALMLPRGSSRSSTRGLSSGTGLICCSF